MKTIQKNWNEFWGDLLMLRCHQLNLKRWAKRQESAEWLYETLSLWPGCRILDLGCGDGILDICIARLGAVVTAIDRIASVLEAARAEMHSEKVDFIIGDLRDMVFQPRSFDVVFMFELVGLMSKADDARLIKGARDWLAKGGRMLIDCPLAPEAKEGLSKQELHDGTLQCEWTYDQRSRLQHIVPAFYMKTGEMIELYDPYDASKPDHQGVLRHLYAKTELRRILEENRFTVREIGQRWRKDAYLLIGSHWSDPPAAGSGDKG